MTAFGASIPGLSDLKSAVPREGYAYWLSKRGDRPFPARGDCDPPVEVPRLARHIMLFDVLHDPLDFRYRLVGDKMREHLGDNYIGRLWSEIPFQCAPNPIWLHHQWVVEHRQPRVYCPNYIGPNHDFLSVESVVLPLGDSPDRADMLMVFADAVSKVKR